MQRFYNTVKAELKKKNGFIIFLRTAWQKKMF